MTSQESNLHILSSDEMCKLNIKNWRHNRPVEHGRIQSIVEYIKNTGKIEGIIYLAKDDTNYFCYDGIHRLTALNHVMNDDRSYSVLVDIMPYDDVKIKKRFIGINSSVPVSELYTEETNCKEHIETVQYVNEYYQKAYPTFFTHKQHYRLPNMNYTTFPNLINTLVSEHTNDILLFTRTYNLTKETLLLFLETFHSYLKLQPKVNRKCKHTQSCIKLTTSQHDKCIKHDMFLFYVSDWYEEIEKYILSIKNNHL